MERAGGELYPAVDWRGLTSEQVSEIVGWFAQWASSLFLKVFTLGAATTDSGRLFLTDMTLSEKKVAANKQF